MPTENPQISVSSKPSGASLIIDGENRGQTPKAGIPVRSGTHHLFLEKKGYTAEQDVVVKSGEKEEFLLVTLRKNRPPVDDSSGLNIVTNQNKEPSPANPPVGPELIGFVEQYFKDTEGRNIGLVLSHYSEQVDYFSKGVVRKDFIRKDKELYFKRWDNYCKYAGKARNTRDSAGHRNREICVSVFRKERETVRYGQG